MEKIEFDGTISEDMAKRVLEDLKIIKYHAAARLQGGKNIPGTSASEQTEKNSE